MVSHSNSFLTPPYDGTGRAARRVDRAAAAGVLWVNSAGNYGQRHWRGTAGARGRRPADRAGPWIAAPAQPLLAGPDAAASVAVERQDAAGAWVEVPRSAAAPLAEHARRAGRDARGDDADPADAAPWRLGGAPERRRRRRR